MGRRDLVLRPQAIGVGLGPDVSSPRSPRLRGLAQSNSASMAAVSSLSRTRVRVASGPAVLIDAMSAPAVVDDTVMVTRTPLGLAITIWKVHGIPWRTSTSCDPVAVSDVVSSFWSWAIPPSGTGRPVPQARGSDRLRHSPGHEHLRKVCPPDCTDHARLCSQKKGGGIVFSDTKSDAGCRRIALARQMLDRAARHKHEQDRGREVAGHLWEDFGLVWCQPNGRPIDARADWQDWKAEDQEGQGTQADKTEEGRWSFEATATDLATSGRLAKVIQFPRSA